MLERESAAPERPLEAENNAEEAPFASNAEPAAKLTEPSAN